MNIENLMQMLAYKRPHGSYTEELFIRNFIEPLRGHANVFSSDTDSKGNYYFTVLMPKGGFSETLFTAHLDSVHYTEGFQKIHVDTAGFTFTSDGECLGANDAAGIWLLINMIDRNVPGTYLFTRGEECGGIGSKYIAQTNPEFLRNYKRAIAFDRKGVHSVITHQAFTRCCSDEFAITVAMRLNSTIGRIQDDYAIMCPDDTGVYTGIAEFVDFIPECTNISIGYYFEHTKREELDLKFLPLLLEAVTQLNFETLPTDELRIENRERLPMSCDICPFVDHDPWGDVYLCTLDKCVEDDYRYDENDFTLEDDWDEDLEVDSDILRPIRTP